MKVDVMKPVTTNSGAAQILFINPKHKKTKSEGKNAQNEILANNFISDGGLKQRNLKYYNSTTFNKSNYAPTKINPNNNANQLHLTTYSVSVRDNSELNVSNVSRDEGIPNNSITKIFVTNASKDKKEIRLKADPNVEINKKTHAITDSNNTSKVKEKNKIANVKNPGDKQGNIKIRATSADSKIKLNLKAKKEEKKSEDYFNTNDANINQIRLLKNKIDNEESKDSEKKEKEPKENLLHHYHTEHNMKKDNKLKKHKMKENELKSKTLSKKDNKLIVETNQDKISSTLSDISKESEIQDRPKKTAKAENKIQTDIINNETNEYNKTPNNVDSNNIKAKTLTQNLEKRNKYNTFNNITPKINKSKNSINSHQSNKENIKILTIEEKIELMGKLVRNKEEEIIKQVQKEVIEKSKQTNEKIQRKLKYLNERNMLDNINIEEMELGVDRGVNEDDNQEINEDTDIQKKEEDNEDNIENENEQKRKMKINYFENSESLNKQKRSKSSPHVPVHNNKRPSKPRINTNEYIKQINNERRVYFGENEDNISKFNIEIENNLSDNKLNEEIPNMNNCITNQKDSNENRLSFKINNNDKNSFRKSNSGDKSKLVQRSASATASLNSRITEGNENFVFSNNFEENYRIPSGSKSNVTTHKRSNAEIQEFIKRKRKEDKENAIKLKNEEDQKSLKKLVELTKIVQTQERFFKRSNYSNSQNPNSNNSVSTYKSKNSEFNRYQENVKKSHSANKIKNEMYVGKKKKNPNDSSIVDPNEYYLTLLESQNILIPTENRKIKDSRKQSERSQIINDENKMNDHSFNTEYKQKIITDYNEKSQSQLISQSQIQSQSRSQSPMNSQIQSETSFNLKLVEKENSRRSLEQSDSNQNIQMIQQHNSQFSNCSQSNQISQNNFIKNSSNIKSSEEKNSVYKQPSKINDDSFGNLNPVIDKSLKEVTKRSIYNSNDVISMKSGNFNSKFDSSSFQQCDTANFKASNDINERLNEMKAKVSEFKQRAINLRENNSKIDIDKSLSARSLISDRREDSLVQEIPKSNDKIQSFIEHLSYEQHRDLRLSDNALNYNEEDIYNQSKSNSFYNKNEEDVYNQMKSVSYDNLFSFNKRDRINSDMEMNYKSCDMNVITNNIASDFNIIIDNQPEDKLDRLKISQDVSYINEIRIKENVEEILQPKINLEKLDNFSSLIRSVINKSVFDKLSDFLISSRKLEQYDMALNYLDAIADGFIAKNVFVSFQMIHQFAIMKNYYDVFNVFTMAAKRDAFQRIREYSEIVKLYEEEELHVYENSFNSLCLFAKRSAFNVIKEFAFNAEINEYEEDLDKLIEVYTISFNKLFFPWKRNIFYEFTNNMYALMMTPRKSDVERLNNNNISNNPILPLEDDNITVQINKGQSPTNSQLWYNKEADDEDIVRKNSNKTIQDKSLSQIKNSLIDDIQIESLANITNKSEVSKHSNEGDNKSTSRSKMQMFNKNAAISNSKPLSVNESSESLSQKINIKNSFRNLKNNTFVHESFTERSLLIEFNSFDSPKLHRIHMLIEQQKRAQEINPQDQLNVTNNISNAEISMSMSNITGRSLDKNSNFNYFHNQSQDYCSDSNSVTNIKSNTKIGTGVNIPNKCSQNNSMKLNVNKSKISNNINNESISEQNLSKNYSLRSNLSIDMHNRNEISYEDNSNIKLPNPTTNDNKIILKSTKSLVNISVNSLKDNRNMSMDVVNKSTSTLNKFSNVNKNMGNNYSNISNDLSYDEISQNISEHLIESRNCSRISEKYSKTDEDVSVDMNKNEYTDIEWIHTISAVSKSGSYPDVNVNDSKMNNTNMVSYDNQKNKSVENSKITHPLEISRDLKPIAVSDTNKENVSKIGKEEIQDEKNQQEVIEDGYGKFEENIEIEIDYNENVKDLYSLVEDDENKNKSVSSVQSNKSERNFHPDNFNTFDAANTNAINSSDIKNYGKSRNITENINKNELSLEIQNRIFKNLSDNKSNSLENISYNELEQFNNQNEESLRQNLNHSLSHSNVSERDKDSNIISYKDAAVVDRNINKSIDYEEYEEKIIIDDNNNNLNDKITIETANENESARDGKISDIEFMAVKQVNSIENNNNILTIESADNYEDNNQDFFKVKPTNEIKSINLLDDKSSNKSSIIPLSDFDYRSIENKDNAFKENQTLSANKRYDNISDDITSVKKSDLLQENSEGNTSTAINEFAEKLKFIDDLNEFSDIITESILKNILQYEIHDESKGLTPKKLFIQEKEKYQSAKKDDIYLMNTQSIANSLSVYSTTSNNLNTSMFNKTVIDHKKESSLNLYQDRVAPRLINLITESIEKNYKNILTNLSHPYTNKPVDLIQAITYRDYKMLRKSHNILPESYIDSTFINKKEILGKFEDTNKKIREDDNITSDNYYDNILNECMVDAANEILKKERHYGDLGEPLPWSTRFRSVRYKYNEYSANNMKKLINDQLTQAIHFKMGLITENNENMEFEILNAERERRLLNKIIEGLDETDEQWKNLEIEETQIKFELSDLICEQLLNEIIEILEHVQLSRRKPQLYKNKSIYACEDIPRLSFQQTNTDHDSDNINQ